jgi:hypothetical protein
MCGVVGHGFRGLSAMLLAARIQGHMEAGFQSGIAGEVDIIIDCIVNVVT